jgi:hypothetical protein
MSKFQLIFLLLFVNIFLYNCQKISPQVSITPTPVVSFSPNTNFTNQNQTQSQTNYGDSQCLVVGDYYISYIIEKNSKKNFFSTDRVKVVWSLSFQQFVHFTTQKQVIMDMHP